MHATFWQERWARDQIGFHQQKVNGYLRRHWSALGLAKGAAVLVPLCGKSLDLVWLAEQGHAVIGVELAERAVQDFFVERDMQPQVSQQATTEESKDDAGPGVTRGHNARCVGAVPRPSGPGNHRREYNEK